MADSNNPQPPPGRDPPFAKVVSLASRRRLDRLAQAAREGPVAPVRAHPTRLDQEQLDAEIAQAERDAADGSAEATREKFDLRRVRARESFDRGDHDAAFAEWGAIINEDPAPVEALLTRGLHHAGLADTEAALADYDRAALLSPQDPRVYMYRGLCYFGIDNDRALANFRRLMQLSPNHPDGYVWAARCVHNRGEHDDGIRLCGRALKLAPRSAAVYCVRAFCLSSKGLRDEARRDFDRCIELEPEDASYLYFRADLHTSSDKDDRRIADLSRAIELDPDNARFLSVRADAHRAMGRPELERGDLTRLLAIESIEVEPGVFEPDELELRDLRARACMKIGAYDDAIADLTRLIDCTSRPDHLRVRRAEAHRKRGDLASAAADYSRVFDQELRDELREERDDHRALEDKTLLLEDLEIALLCRPTDSHAFRERGAIYLAQEKYDQAKADFDRAIALSPPIYDELFHLRAEAHAYLGEMEEAIEDESRAIAIAPYVAIYRMWRGCYRAWSDGASKEAEADLLRAVELDPENLIVLDCWADYLLDAERYEEALGVHDLRIALRPGYGFLYAARAEARLRASSSEASLRAALADFDRALADDGSDPKLLRRRAEVHALLGGSSQEVG